MITKAMVCNGIDCLGSKNEIMNVNDDEEALCFVRNVRIGTC